MKTSIKTTMLANYTKAFNDKYYAMDLLKDVEDGVETSKGMVGFGKKPLKKVFCISYKSGQGTEQDQANKEYKRAISDPSYFIEQNLKDYDELIEDLKNHKIYWSSFWAERPSIAQIRIIKENTFNGYLEYNQKFKFGKFSEDDIEKLIEVIEKLRTKREKCCNTYLNKYGLSKINAFIVSK